MLTGTIGEWALRLLLPAIASSICVHAAAAKTGSPGWRRRSRQVAWLPFALAAVASAALICLLVREDWAYAYVAEYTGSGLPLIYRIAAFWGGNAGSLLFWVLMLTLYAAVVAQAHHEDSERMLPLVSLILALMTAFYALVVNVVANPFARLPHPAEAGNGLNPLLQHPGMTVHPVNVYLGYIGFSVPFAYAMAGLWLRRTDSVWLTVTRRWTLVSWLFLSIGIVYGAHWSYEELGWGGYWAWDPVENASLLPWLTATAFLHSAIVQERRGMLKAWNIVLITLTYLLTLLGTFLTRSGVLWSIHAFANGPLGIWFAAFVGVATAASAALIAVRWRTLRADRSFEAVVSKETGFMLNNVLFLGSTFAVLWGTVYPLVSEWAGQPMVVGPPFYNKVNLPLAVCILLLMGIGPMVAWRRSSAPAVGRTVLYPMLISTGFGLALSGWLEHQYHHQSALGTAGLVAAVFVLWTVGQEFVQAVRARVRLTGESWPLSLVRLVSRHRRRYGGYIVHLGVAVMAIGIAGSGVFHVDLEQQLRVGQTSAPVAGYQATFAGMGVEQGPGTRRLYANLVIRRDGQVLGLLRPAATFYSDGQQPTTDVALYSRPLRDLYVVMIGTSQGESAVFDFHVNPLVQWIWWGGYLFIAGTIVSLWPERRQLAQATWPAAAVLAPVTTAVDGSDAADLYAQWAELEYDHLAGKVPPDMYRRQRDELIMRIRAMDAASIDLRTSLESEVEAAVQEVRSRAAPPEAGDAALGWGGGRS
ncbi:MAG: heme lyase CcmF/NrfE family subunit [Alicyclobacillaceae bacterium]|nr:heme lyase CcmF/NrfE family subunit [Alicyclobacillaceae bacterium]